MNRTHYLGQAVAFENAASYLLERAGVYFGRHQDTEATLLRSLSGKFTEDAKALRKVWQDK